MQQNCEIDVVVVGGGVAGLATTGYLARAGCSVTLFEQAKQPGGRASSQVRSSFVFNRGIHALYTGGAASEVLAELGVAYSGGSPKEVWALWQGKLYRSPATPPTLLASPLFGVRDKLELIRVLSSVPRLDAFELRWLSVQTWLETEVKRPRVLAFLRALASTLTYTTALELVSAEVLIDKLQRSIKHPVVYLDGGWQTLVEGLRRVAEAAGAKVVTGLSVEAVVYASGRVRGVQLRDGQRVDAKAVVLAVRPKDAAKLADHPAVRALAEATTPVRLACLDVALRQLPVPKHAVVQDLERPLFMSAQSQVSKVAPAGGALVYAFKQLHSRQPSDPQEAERDLERFLDATQKGWRELLVERQFLPRIEAVGTLPTAKTGGFSGRPSVKVPDCGNLFLAGDWVGSRGFLVDASLASAREAARMLLDGGGGEAAKVGDSNSKGHGSKLSGYVVSGDATATR